MLVKCIICGAKVPRDHAFRIAREYKGKDGTMKTEYRYCCSEDEYNADEARKKKDFDEKDRVYRLLCEILGVKDIINTILYKEWQEWNMIATNEQIAILLCAKKKYLCSAMSTKLCNSSEYARIRYISGIIKNSLNDFQRGVDRDSVETTDKNSSNTNVDIDYIFMSDIQNRENNNKRTLAEIEALFT